MAIKVVDYASSQTKVRNPIVMQLAKRFLTLTLSSLLIASCNARVDSDEQIDMSNGGAFSLKLTPFDTPSLPTKLSTIPIPTLNDFDVDVFVANAD